tara:strand:- start:3920 stop:4543 length:624 start_codon:yes stop_codon:yes gene_type:complete
MITTFQPINIGPTEDERQLARDEILSVDDSHWFYDPFRNCKMLPFYNGGGLMGKESSHDKIFDYTEAGEKCSVGMDICEKYIFSWADPYPRITILKTDKDSILNPHLDCSTAEVGTPQYKFRIVLSGKIDNLYFIDEKYNKKYIPSTHKEYILDGGHPHGLDASEEIKLTMCAGAPWGRTEIPKNIMKAENMVVTRPSHLEESWYRQ